MVRILLSAALLAASVLVAGCAAPGPAAAVAGMEAQLRELLVTRLAANRAGDRSFYENLLAPEFAALLPYARALGRSEYLEHEFGGRAGPVAAPPATVDEVDVRVCGDGAVMRYRAFEPNAVGTVVFVVQTWRLDSYVRRDGRWRLLTMAVTEPPQWPDPVVLPASTLDELVGRYRLGPDAYVDVARAGDHLMAKVTGQSASELFAESPTTFFDRGDSPLARTVFERDRQGRVVAQVYVAQGQRQRATREP